MANADAGTTGNYIAIKDIKFIQNVKPCNSSNTIRVKVANGNVMTSSHIGQLISPDGSTLTAHIFSDLDTSLLSISEFVDLGYIVTYDSNSVKFMKQNQIVFTGHRDNITKLWMINLSLFNQFDLQANPTVRINSIVEFVRYWHACFCYPPKSTFVRALTSFLKVPGLQAHDVQKHLPNITFTAFGHLDATRKNLKSTKLMIGP